MCTRLAVLWAFSATLGFCGDWNPKLAADYLDSRQKAWIEWPNALRNGITCTSCHTNLMYLLSRPALESKLRDASPYKEKLLGNLRLGLSRRTPEDSPSVGTESILAALLLVSEDSRHGTLSKDTEEAFARLWALQIESGKYKGSWHWFSQDLDPWEEPESAYFGAALAALAVGTAPAEYRARPELRANLEALKSYLDTAHAGQPLHNRLMLLWASAKWRDLLPESERKAIAAEAISKQRDDGGWSIQSLGPWKEHPKALPAEGSSAYATAVAAFTLQQGAIAKSDAAVRHALEWLRSHQDTSAGYWDAVSMNKRYEAGSMMEQFMRDAATGFAVLALLAQ